MCIIKLKGSQKDSSYIKVIFSIVASHFYGYFIHYLFHKISFVKIYKECDNIFTRNKYSNTILNMCVEIMDFHHSTHHDSSVNKTLTNIIYEFLNNILFQGIGLVIFIQLFIKLIDIRVFIIWALTYATVHNINFLFVNPSTHRDHHKNYNTNFAVDYMDILFNTKYDCNDIEDMNHYSINTFILTYLVVYLMS